MRGRFLWRVHPAWGLGEAWLLGLLILGGLAGITGYVQPFVLNSGALFLCGTCGMWAVLRIRLPQGRPLRQALWELAVGVALSAVMAAGLRLPARLLGWEVIWEQAGWGSAWITGLTAFTGLGYLLCRAGVRLWLAWDRLRRRQMRWALTHAHLLVVLAVALLGALGLFLVSPYSRATVLTPAGAANPLMSFVVQVLVYLLPSIILVVLFTAVALVLVLPPSALLSYLVARRTTRRLETLAVTAAALRAGDYAARVPVAGEDEVARLQADFNAMADQLEQTLRDVQAQRDTVSRLLQSRRELVASVSHELRTPVTTVRALLESALESPPGTLTPAMQHDLEVMDGEVLRLQVLIDDLFTLAQAQAAGLSLTCRPTDIAPVVRRMVEVMAPLAWNAGRVEVAAEVPPGLPQVSVDEGRLEQVLANLLRNAVRHTPPGGIVAVLAAEEEADVRLEVRDTGAGIAPEDLPHIWERFFRGAESRQREAGGAGLGLALVKELTEAMGGRVAVASTVGQGSCFTVWLPRV